MATLNKTTARFWRDPDLPFVEALDALDGRQLCYANYAHEAFSIGADSVGH